MDIWLSITWMCIAVLAFHFVGYPAIMALLSRVAARPTLKAEAIPSVSLIVSAYNEEEVIQEKIRNSRELDYPADRLEIIVVSDGSTDATAHLVKEAGDSITLLHSDERRGKGAAMNRAAAHARGEILVFSDANALYRPDALRKLMANFSEPVVGAASGKKTVTGDSASATQSEGLYWRYESWLKEAETRIGSTAGVVGEMMAVRRCLYAPIPPDIINDDVYLLCATLSQGYRVNYEPEAVCWEEASHSMDDDKVRRRRISAGRFQLLFRPSLWPWGQPLVLFQLMSHKFLRLLLPLFMAGALVGNLAVVSLPDAPRYMFGLLVAQLAFYTLAGLGWHADRRGRRWKLPYVAYYVTSGSLSNLGGLRQYLSGQQTVLWEKAQR